MQQNLVLIDQFVMTIAHQEALTTKKETIAVLLMVKRNHGRTATTNPLLVTKNHGKTETVNHLLATENLTVVAKIKLLTAIANRGKTETAANQALIENLQAPNDMSAVKANQPMLSAKLLK